MTTVTIENADSQASTARFRASAGRLQSTGHTPGQALDSLLAEEGPTVDTSTILIQRLVPDAHFTQAQHERMKDLLARCGTLTHQEENELDALIDAELDATVSRTDELLARVHP